jgi:ribose 5-phosphate isomerase B
MAVCGEGSENRRRGMNKLCKVAIASDFSGFNLKEAVKKYLMFAGYAVEDVGQINPEDRVLYYEAASSLAKTLQSGVCKRGIVICGTGAGVSLIINKFRGIYCVACESVFTAQRLSLINNANVLAMGEKVVSQEMACEMAREWLNGVWCEGFDEQRKKNNERGFQVLQEIESWNFK